MSLDIQNLSKTFYDEDGNDTTTVLQDIAASIETGTFVSVIGPSGCGKTTLLRIIAGLESVSDGRILINGSVRREPWEHVGFVFQEYALFPWRTVSENIEFGLEIKGISRHERRTRSRKIVDDFGLDGFGDKFPGEISGGMKQRVALARTLINEPTIILMDEPFGALDSQTRCRMQKFLYQIWKSSEKTILFVTHTIDEAVFLGQRVIGLTSRPGRIALDLSVDMEYPRVVTSDEFNDYRRRIIDFLNAQVMESPDA